MAVQTLGRLYRAYTMFNGVNRDGNPQYPVAWFQGGMTGIGDASGGTNTLIWSPLPNPNDYLWLFKSLTLFTDNAVATNVKALIAGGIDLELGTSFDIHFIENISLWTGTVVVVPNGAYYTTARQLQNIDVLIIPSDIGTELVVESEFSANTNTKKYYMRCDGWLYSKQKVVKDGYGMFKV